MNALNVLQLFHDTYQKARSGPAKTIKLAGVVLSKTADAIDQIRPHVETIREGMAQHEVVHLSVEAKDGTTSFAIPGSGYDAVFKNCSEFMERQVALHKEQESKSVIRFGRA